MFEAMEDSWSKLTDNEIEELNTIFENSDNYTVKDIETIANQYGI